MSLSSQNLFTTRTTAPVDIKGAAKTAAPADVKKATKCSDIRSDAEKEAVASLIPVMGEILTRLAKINTPSNFQALEKSEQITKFHSMTIAAMSIANYLKRLANYLDLTEDSLLYMLIYIKRIEMMCKLKFSEYTAHRIIITSLLIAVKFINDHYYDNRFFAEVGGLSLEELNKLEVEFLYGIDFNLYALDYQDGKKTGEITTYREEVKSFQQEMQAQQNSLNSQPICKLP